MTEQTQDTVSATSEQTSKHSSRRDDALGHEIRGLVQGGRGSRDEEWRDPEPAGEDQPTGDVGVVPEDRRGTPAGMTQADLELRSQIARALGKEVYPADREALVLRAADNDAPDEVVERLRGLPAHETFENVQDVAVALGLPVESRRS